jgi:RNA polymerase sigma-70 factor (ECF subfamily)
MWRRRTSSGSPTTLDPPGDDDLELVVRAMADPRAFEPLYQKYLPRVYGFCANKLRDGDEAWDATGVTFHKALAGVHSYQGGSFESWLFRIAGRACIDVHRARRPHIPLDPETELPAAEPNPEDEAIAAMERDQLEAALRQLPPRRERIVRLHLTGLKGKEIAARLGISHDLVRQEQRRALLQLAELLDIDKPGEEGGRG